MTAILEKPQGTPQWGAMPGWGIVGDLTPPELIAARRLHTLRRLIAFGLGLVLVLCIVGYGYALVQHSRAQDDLDNASAQTTALDSTSHKYSGITQIEGLVAGVKGQIASAMQYDVDTAALVARLREALPGTMSIQNLTLAITNPTSTSGTSSSSTNLDASGRQIIGTVTITGAGRQLTDVAAYVDKLASIRGVDNVVPTSNAVAKGVTQYSITLSLTDALYSHHFDATAKGGK
jgi:hypothetical protein